MLNKSIMIIIFMYTVSISYLTIEYSIIDVFHITVTNFEGDELSGGLVQTWMQMETFNDATADIINGTYDPTNGTFYNRVETSVTAAAAVTWVLISLLTGLYIFNLIAFLGVPTPFIIGLAILYVILLARTIIGLLQRV